MDAYLRALQLSEVKRYEEAVGLFIEHLAQFPDDDEAHAQLALTRLDMPGERRKALESIDAAIALDADCPDYHAYRALILTVLDRDRDALKSADAAIGLEPELVVGIGKFAQARAVEALDGMNLKTGSILHPSPASPLANRGWAAQATSQLQEMGIELTRPEIGDSQGRRRKES